MKSTIFFLVMCFLTSVYGQELIEKSGKEYNFNLNGKKILVIIGDNTEYNEAVVLPDYWKKWGAEISIAGSKKIVPAHIIQLGSNGIEMEKKEITTDLLINDIKVDSYDMLYFPGGSGPDFLIKNFSDEIVKIIRKADEKKKIIAGFCHGPIVLLKAGIVNGKKITGELKPEEITGAGGIPVAAKFLQDGNLATGNYPYVESFAVGVAGMLSGKKIDLNKLQSLPDFALGTTEHFTDKPVENKIIKNIVESANMTVYDFLVNSYKPWKVIAVTDPQKIELIKQTVLNELMKTLINSKYNETVKQKIITDHIAAPAYLVIAMEKKIIDARFGTLNLNQGYLERMLALHAGTFIGNLRLAADKIGLGTNLMLNFPVITAEEGVAKIIDLPSNMMIASIICIGYPSEKGLPQTLRPVDESLYFNKYNH